MRPATSKSEDIGTQSGRRSNWKRNTLGVTVSFVCIGFIFTRLDIGEVSAAITDFQWVYLLWGTLSLAIGYTFRIIRWTVMLRAAGATVTPMACTAPFLGSIALNNVLPMRVGDIVRALVFPSGIGVSRTAATGSLVMERLVDLMTLIACLAAGLLVTATTQLPEWVSQTALVMACMGSVALAFLFLFSHKLSLWCQQLSDRLARGGRHAGQRAAATLANLLDSFDSMSRPRTLIALFGLSMLVWIGEAGLFWAILAGFGLAATPAIAVVVMAIATLSTLAPSSPGYVGPFHLAAFAAISMFGGSEAGAASFAVLSHLGVWMPTTLAGALALLINPQLFSAAKVSARPNQ